MRPRNKADAKNRCLASPKCIALDGFNLIHPAQLFSNSTLPVYAEIGFGKGTFLMQNAQMQPKINWLGIEKIPVITLKAIRLVDKNAPELTNLLFALDDAAHLNQRLVANSLSGLYLNFSDPWPKKRHAKRRLVHHTFLNIYHDLLLPNALFEFKTDQAALFDFCLEELKTIPSVTIVALTRDLYALPVNHSLRQNNVATEYEQKFTQLNMPIYKLRLTFK